MKKIFKYSGVIVTLIIVGILTLYFNNDIGVLRENIEKEARVSQKISDDWQVAKQTTDLMSAMIFYSNDQSDDIFSIYVNRPGISFGYFFRAGGSPIENNGYVSEYYIEGYQERAFISNNKQKINRIEINDGNSIKTVDIDSEKPFAIILPVNTGIVTIYDIRGNIIKSIPYNF